MVRGAVEARLVKQDTTPVQAMPYPGRIEFKFVVLDSNDFNLVLWEGG